MPYTCNISVGYNTNTSLEEVSKKSFMTNNLRQYYTQTMFKVITMKNDRVNIQVKYPLQFDIYTKRMELFELYSKEKAIFFLKSLFIKVSCVVNFNEICGLLKNR